MATDSIDAPEVLPSGTDGSALRVWAFRAVLVAACYLYVLLRINPALIYQTHWVTVNLNKGVPVFYFSVPFLREFARYPGGPVECGAALLAQFHQVPWMGALTLTALTLVLGAASHVLLKAFGGRRPRFLHLVAPLLFLVMHNLYLDPLPTSLALAMALVSACAYVRLPWRCGVARLAAFAVASVPLYYVLGSAYLVCAFLCGTYELLVRRRYVSGVLWLAYGGLLPYFAGVRPFLVSPRLAYTHLMPFRYCLTWFELGLGVALYAFLPLAAVTVAVWRGFREGGASGLEGQVNESREANADEPRGVLWRVVHAAAPWLLVAAVLFFAFGSRMKAITAVDYYAMRRDWRRVLEWEARVPLAAMRPGRPSVLERVLGVPLGKGDDSTSLSHAMVTEFIVNRALYFSGQLGDRMFQFARYPSGLLLSRRSLPDLLAADQRGWMQHSAFMIELGLVNEAEHVTYEVIETFGWHPRHLERIALCSIVKGQPRVARTLLNAMSRAPLYGGQARKLLRMLERDPLLTDNEAVSRLRARRMPQNVIGWQPAEVLLTRLLEHDEGNRMAFEYLMAHYLRVGKLNEFARNLSRLDDFDGYEVLPVHYEEALLILAGLDGEPVDLGGRRIRSETVERFRQFRRALNRLRGADVFTVMERLEPFRGTYFYHHHLISAMQEAT